MVLYDSSPVIFGSCARACVSYVPNPTTHRACIAFFVMVMDGGLASGRNHSSRRWPNFCWQSPPSASGPGEQSRTGKSRKPRGAQQQSSASANGSGNKPSADILSADPSTLEVRARRRRLMLPRS